MTGGADLFRDVAVLLAEEDIRVLLDLRAAYRAELLVDVVFRAKARGLRTGAVGTTRQGEDKEKDGHGHESDEWAHAGTSENGSTSAEIG
jgi:hypothetical protein